MAAPTATGASWSALARKGGTAHSACLGGVVVTLYTFSEFYIVRFFSSRELISHTSCDRQALFYLWILGKRILVLRDRIPNFESPRHEFPAFNSYRARDLDTSQGLEKLRASLHEDEDVLRLLHKGYITNLVNFPFDPSDDPS